ncbi:PREDICTED: connector enhancer of kinase suppressor of ras 1 isoform X3 [Hipposideros armiger]|uniref:Connector enhancer of kinase suppressor of ras 1 isoform X3 n=1 Tax=Hipposideros armiger TaxID=186990 RepID=A0A8B7S246_HIPAR|nr:PREDICTED: connector enhancer of kinase suppressor of ras 1 isoform X3 [Hipposideros armiger]
MAVSAPHLVSHVGPGMLVAPPRAQPGPSPALGSGSGNSCAGGTDRTPIPTGGLGHGASSDLDPREGLDDSLQDYCFEDWELPGKYLLQLCPRSLEALTVWPIGHQELILEGVEQLRALTSGLQTENLQSLTEGLLKGTHAFQSLVQGCLGGCAETPAEVLSAAVNLVREARTLLFWLNRYLFSHLNDFSACQEIGELCGELGQALQEDCPAAEKESQILKICSHVAGICHNILSCSPQELLEQRAVLERVQLEDPLGLEIHTTSNCLHFVSRVGTELQIQPGDEIVQINEQVVVGWPHKNVVRELLREPAGVSLVLKKVPVPETPPQTPPPALDFPQLRVPSLVLAPPSPRASSEDIFAFDLTSNPSSGPSPDSTGSFKAPPGGGCPGQDSASLDPEPLSIAPVPPATLPAEVAETQRPSEDPDKSSVPGRKKSKGVATRLSRRRVSCRELGLPDCDGWLLLRKVPGGFMGPRWRRCWFVLKGHTLYWYRQPQDEKAEGLINVSNYSLESGHDQKKKYVFQLTHDVYKPFIFAADTLADLSMWVRHLITCISKYQSPGRGSLPREEDCYSETEAEDPDDEAGSRSASPSPAQAWSPLHGDTSPAATPMQGSPETSFSLPTDNYEGSLEGMVQGLRQGGLSLLGQPQPFTHEQWRSSFMRRNRDPQLNERVHHVRALQSTLKAKLQELQALEEVLSDPELTGEKFRRWKEQNQELYTEGLAACGEVQAEGSSQVLTSDSREQSFHPLPSDPEENAHLCPLAPESNLQPPDL